MTIIFVIQSSGKVLLYLSSSNDLYLHPKSKKGCDLSVIFQILKSVIYFFSSISSLILVDLKFHENFQKILSDGLGLDEALREMH